MVAPIMLPDRSSAPRRVVVTLAALGLLGAGCQMGTSAASSSGSKTPAQLGIFKPEQLPDPCKLVSGPTIGALIQAAVSPVEAAPASAEGQPMLFRACTWGDTKSPAGAIGIQIGVADVSGHDVVANRSTAMDPALATSVGEDAKETMNLGELPTGGGKGASIFFHHNGYSILIGHVGKGAALATVEDLAKAVMKTLDA